MLLVTAGLGELILKWPFCFQWCLNIGVNVDWKLMINIILELWERKRDETCRDLQFHLCHWQGGEVCQVSSDVLAQLHCPMARSGPDPAHVYLNQIPFKSKLLWWIILKNRSKNPYQSDFDLNEIEIWLRYMHTGSGSDPALGQCRLSLAWKPLAGHGFIRPRLAKTEAWAELVGLGWLRLGFSPSHGFMQLHTQAVFFFYIYIAFFKYIIEFLY